MEIQGLQMTEPKPSPGLFKRNPPIAGEAEAIERAKLDPLSLRGSDTGIFVGINPSGYAFKLPSELEGYQVTASAGVSMK